MFGAKVLRNGIYFTDKKFVAACKCGCIYRVPKRRAKVIREDFVFGTVYVRTRCPECMREVNTEIARYEMRHGMRYKEPINYHQEQAAQESEEVAMDEQKP